MSSHDFPKMTKSVKFSNGKKKDFFPEIKRMILVYEYVETPEGFQINVIPTF